MDELAWRPPARPNTQIISGVDATRMIRQGAKEDDIYLIGNIETGTAEESNPATITLVWIGSAHRTMKRDTSIQKFMRKVFHL
jgi:hypothetical protein